MDLITKLILVLIVSGAGAYLGSYLKQRGKNLATKEDIADITDKVEAIRAVYAADLEDRKASHQLRTACLERRMVAHQEAYTLWRKLVGHVHHDDCPEVVRECQNWWDKNCLFLDAAPREAFRSSFLMANQHRDLLKGRSEVPIIKENWATIIAAGPTIEAAVGLPPIRGDVPEQSETGSTT